MSRTRIFSQEEIQYAADVARVLNEVQSGKASYGEFYVRRAEIHFDGEATGLAVEADEHGTYSLSIEEGE